MGRDSVTLPSGYRLAYYDMLGSTNTEALRLATAGEAGGLWIWAARQSAGKGRAGRSWVSEHGNLYASLLIRPRVALNTAMQLSLLAGVAVHDALSGLRRSPNGFPDLFLKWPNDILLKGAKLGGILLESSSTAGADDIAVVIGIGINVAHAPEDLGRDAASLAGSGLPVAPAEVFTALADTMATWLNLWENGEGFDAIRTAWGQRAQSIGQPISVHWGGKPLSGVFLGIDDAGALRLSLPGGEERRITAGDVSIGAGNRSEKR
jgi:BirA family biotin operon repressor/biotin-[acetyl-CoA-carboxylase] ligase